MVLVEFTPDPQCDNRRNDAIALVQAGPALVEVELTRSTSNHDWTAWGAFVLDGDPELVDLKEVMAWAARRLEWDGP